jgi:hypothetical protein
MNGSTRWNHQQLEMARLDALQVALWGQAIAGVLDACREVGAIIMARVPLLGLTEQPKRLAWLEAAHGGVVG